MVALYLPKTASKAVDISPNVARLLAASMHTAKRFLFPSFAAIFSCSKMSFTEVLFLVFLISLIELFVFRVLLHCQYLKYL